MKRKRRLDGKLAELFGEMFELPSAVSVGGTAITVTDGREVYISGCRAILSYSDEYIEVETNVGGIGINGMELDISRYTDSEITVHGDIRSVTISGENKKC